MQLKPKFDIPQQTFSMFFDRSYTLSMPPKQAKVSGYGKYMYSITVNTALLTIKASFYQKRLHVIRCRYII